MCLLFINMQACASQTCIFRSVELERGKLNLTIKDTSASKGEDTYHKISLCNMPNGILLNYDLIIEENIFSGLDTIKAIEELLGFEGDTSLCVLRVLKYNNRSSNFWIEEQRDYSIQLEALYLINLLALNKPFQYAPIPALEDTKSKEKATIKGEIIQKAFEAYRIWFKVVKNQGLKKTLSEGYYPLDNSGISWY